MTMSVRQSLMAIFAITVMAASAHAAKLAKSAHVAALPPPPAVSVMSQDQYDKAMKDARTSSRRVADIDKVNEATALSPELKNIRAQIIGGETWSGDNKTGKKISGIQSADGIAALINDLEGRYDSLPMDAKLVAAQVIALKPYRSIVYRARHLIDSAQLSKTMIITALRLAAAGQNAFFPNEQWKAGFDYLTAPSAGMGADIVNEDDLTTFVREYGIPTGITLVGRLQAMDFKTPVYFDNKMAYSQANFVSDDDRYALVGETERKLAISGVYLGLSSAYVGMAYNWLGAFDTSDKIARVYGFRSAIGNSVEGATAQTRNSYIRANKNLFTLKPGGEVWTRAAYPLFVDGVRYAKLAWQASKADANSNNNLNNLIDPRGLLPFTRQIDATLNGVQGLIEGDGLSSAIVMGEKVDVRFKELFDNPPEDLKVFLPVGYDKGEKVISSPFARDKGGDLKGGYRNYLQGSPTAWCTTGCKAADGKDAKSYNHYFPGVKSSEDVKRAARIMNQTWGGGLVGIPFAAMVF